MTLFTATVLPAVLLLALGGALFAPRERLMVWSAGMLRSRAFDAIAFGIPALWFLYHVLQLGEADFGQLRNILFVAFATVGIGAWLYMPDFLGIRGVAMFTLLLAHELLRAAFQQYDLPQRLFMVSFVYISIVAALYFGSVPFRFRDLRNWLLREGQPLRAKLAGGAFAAYGAVLLVVSFTY